MKKLMSLMAVFIAVPVMAAPAKVTLCHILSDPPQTMSVPAPAVDAHLAHGDYLGACVAPEPTPEPTPDPTQPAPVPNSAPASNSPAVIDNMWLIRGQRIDLDSDGTPTRIRGSYCILISDTHPSVEVQTAKCFPGDGWFPNSAFCAGSVTADDVWACDDELAEYGWSRLPLAELCERHPQWCGR